MDRTVGEALLSTAPVRACCQRAELAVMLRFAPTECSPELLAAEFPSHGTAVRCALLVQELYGSVPRVLEEGTQGRSPRWRMRAPGGPVLARQSGIVTPAGRPVVGLPAFILSGQRCDAAAAWRAALLMAGALPSPVRGACVTVRCAGPEVGMALVAAARRLGVAAALQVLSDRVRVDIRSVDEGVVLLAAAGAGTAAEEWRARLAARRERGPSTSLEGFEAANARRSSRAAAQAAGRLADALELLGDSAPSHLVEAARLRVQHPDVGLKELGAMAVPPLTKDAIAGRLRRLLDLAGQPEVLLASDAPRAQGRVQGA